MNLPREQIFAQKMAAGSTIKQAMLDAGYPPSRATRGIAGLNKRMLKALSKEGLKMAQFGKSLSLEELKNIAIGRLATNAIQGKDGGVMSAKTIGSHRDLNLWTPEVMAGVIVIAPPTPIVEKKEKLLEVPPPEE